MILKSLFPAVTKKHMEKNILATHPLHLFRIIQDVDRYDSFLPLCSYSKILQISPDGRTFDARLKVGSPSLFLEEYVSRVTVIPERLTIQTESIESSRFDSLKSKWVLSEVNADQEVHCNVEFEVEMTVSEPIVVAALDKVLKSIAGYQVGAFQKRCKEEPIPYALIEEAGRFKYK